MNATTPTQPKTRGPYLTGPRRKLVLFLAKAPGATYQDVLHHIPQSRETVEALVRRAAKAGLIRKTANPLGTVFLTLTVAGQIAATVSGAP